jgi:hypothetical protein
VHTGGSKAGFLQLIDHIRLGTLKTGAARGAAFHVIVS